MDGVPDSKQPVKRPQGKDSGSELPYLDISFHVEVEPIPDMLR